MQYPLKAQDCIYCNILEKSAWYIAIEWWKLQSCTSLSKLLPPLVFVKDSILRKRPSLSSARLWRAEGAEIRKQNNHLTIVALFSCKTHTNLVLSKSYLACDTDYIQNEVHDT